MESTYSRKSGFYSFFSQKERGFFLTQGIDLRKKKLWVFEMQASQLRSR